MIPKLIHYCWFGKSPLPKEYENYMQSWQNHMPDYEIVRWDESNFDIRVNTYCEEAYKAGKFAFVSDYARLYALYTLGGIYLDTDVELLRSLLPLISEGIGYVGFQNPYEVNTGLGFAAPPHNSCIKEMMDIYEQRHFLRNNTYDLTPCPAANTAALMNCGLKTGRKYSQETQRLDGIIVYPEYYFNPINRDTMKCAISKNTYSIHHYAGSWVNTTSFKALTKQIIPPFILSMNTAHVSRRDIRRIKRDCVKKT